MPGVPTPAQAYIPTENLIRDRLIRVQIMKPTRLIPTACILAGSAVLFTTGILSVRAQDGERAATAIFNSLDPDNDGSMTRPEMEAGFSRWFTAWNTNNSGTLTQPQIMAGLGQVLPAPPPVKPGQSNTFNPVGNQRPLRPRKRLWMP